MKLIKTMVIKALILGSSIAVSQVQYVDTHRAVEKQNQPICINDVEALKTACYMAARRVVHLLFAGASDSTMNMFPKVA